jgi:hypothetical protein
MILLFTFYLKHEFKMTNKSKLNDAYDLEIIWLYMKIEIQIDKP